jgi:hypothetical protein
VTDRGTDTLSRRGEQDPLGESTLVIRIQLRNFWMDDNRESDASACEVTGVGAFDCRQSAEHLAIADNHEFPRLPIAGAARPAGNLEDVRQNAFGERVRSQLSNGA